MSLINDALKRAKQSQQRQPENRPVNIPLQPAAASSQGGFPIWAIPVVLAVVLLAAGWFFRQWWRSSRTGLVASAATQAASLQPAPAPPGPAAVAPQPAQPLPSAVNREPGRAGRAANMVRISTNLVTRTGSSNRQPAANAADSVVGVVGVIAEGNGAPSSAPPAATVAPQGTPLEASAVDAEIKRREPVPPGSTINSEASARIPTPVSATQPASTAWPELKLQGIFYRRTKPSALINGETLFEGEEISGAILVRVERQSVLLRFKGQTNILRLGNR